MNAMFSIDGPPSQLVNWLHKPTRSQLRHAIAVGSRCCTDLPFIGSQIAQALNQQAPEDQRLWRAFEINELWHLAGDPAHRKAILEDHPCDYHPGPPDSDIDRITRRLARIGGAILEGQYALDATTQLDNTFRICLCNKFHDCPGECHLLLNPDEYNSRRNLATAIASAFLDWEPTHPIPPNFRQVT